MADFKAKAGKTQDEKLNPDDLVGPESKDVLEEK